MDPYTILGVTTQTPYVDTRKAYFRLCLRYHPDRNPGRDTTEIMQRINDAYDILASRNRPDPQRPSQDSPRQRTYNTTSEPRQPRPASEDLPSYQDTYSTPPRRDIFEALINKASRDLYKIIIQFRQTFRFNVSVADLSVFIERLRLITKIIVYTKTLAPHEVSLIETELLEYLSKVVVRKLGPQDFNIRGTYINEPLKPFLPRLVRMPDVCYDTTDIRFLNIMDKFKEYLPIMDIKDTGNRNHIPFDADIPVDVQRTYAMLYGIDQTTPNLQKILRNYCTL
jgi:hypothetical protein